MIKSFNYPETFQKCFFPPLILTLLCVFFFILQTVRHGFPYQPTALAFDPVQKILAVGSRSGGVRMYPLLIIHFLSAFMLSGDTLEQRTLCRLTHLLSATSVPGFYHCYCHTLYKHNHWNIIYHILYNHTQLLSGESGLPEFTEKEL